MNVGLVRKRILGAVQKGSVEMELWDGLLGGRMDRVGYEAVDSTGCLWRSRLE